MLRMRFSIGSGSCPLFLVLVVDLSGNNKRGGGKCFTLSVGKGRRIVVAIQINNKNDFRLNSSPAFCFSKPILFVGEQMIQGQHFSCSIVIVHKSFSMVSR